MNRRPEGQPIPQETEVKPEILLSLSGVLEIINKSPLLLDHQKTEISQRLSSIETTKLPILQLIEALEISLGIEEDEEEDEIEGLNLEERADLVVDQIVNIVNTTTNLETTLEIEDEEKEGLSLKDKVDLISSKVEELKKELIKGEEEIEDKEREIDYIKEHQDPNLVVRAVVEGLLGVSFNQLNPQEHRRIEDEVRRLEIEGFDPNKV